MKDIELTQQEYINLVALIEYEISRLKNLRRDLDEHIAGLLLNKDNLNSIVKGDFRWQPKTNM